MNRTSGFSNKRLRDIERIAHIVGGTLLLLYVYALVDASWFTIVVRAVVLPVLFGSGFAMWQFPRVRRWWNGRRAALQRPA